VRPAPSVAPAATLLSAGQSVSQSVSRYSTVGGLQSTAAVVAEFGRALAAGRYVAVANKVLIL